MVKIFIVLFLFVSAGVRRHLLLTFSLPLPRPCPECCNKDRTPSEDKVQPPHQTQQICAYLKKFGVPLKRPHLCDRGKYL